MRIANNYNYNPNTYNPNFQRNWQEHVSWGAKLVKEKSKADFKLFTFPDAKAVFVEVAQKAGADFGKIRDRVVRILASQGAIFSFNEFLSKDDDSKVYPMENKGDGIFEAKNVDAKENAQYRFIILDKDNKIELVKDPYAKKQTDINGWSEIYNPDNYTWEATDWLEGKDLRRIVRKPNEPLRGLENLIIEEISIPTLSKEGTFDKAKKYIDTVASKGIATAIEILPVENTYSLQWGYDGVDKFAVNEKLGGAAKLKEFIDYAHSKGLNVIMDMVPNHMGPDGDYLPQTGPYEKGPGDFGAKLNYEGEHNRYVRDWMVNAALWWANEFKVDGIRFDMTKETSSDYFLKQVVEELNEHNPLVFTIAEDGRDNKESVTRYDDKFNEHDEALNFIDMNVDFIHKKNWRTSPHAVGFDSEWDFPFMHELKTSLTTNNPSIEGIDRLIRKSQHRIKYVMSHDEIGNWDGTRLIPKVIAVELDLFNKVKGDNDAQKGQNAAHAAQKLAELSHDKKIEMMSDKEFKATLKNIGIIKTGDINKEAIEEAFLIAIAKQKLAHATIMTIPGPKMYFQGDDEANLSYFKFFREFSGDQYKRAHDPNYVKNIIDEKGYDTLESVARADSIIKYDNPDGSKYVRQFRRFARNLDGTLKFNPVLQKGEIINTYKDHYNKVHIHHLKYGDEEVLVLKHFGTSFFDKYSYPAFPVGVWKEVFNSDQGVFGGSGYTNGARKEITGGNQNLSFAPNSIIILKKV